MLRLTVLPYIEGGAGLPPTNAFKKDFSKADFSRWLHHYIILNLVSIFTSNIKCWLIQPFTNACYSESFQDVLEKIRECGSTVTYYGGRVVNNKSPELSPMTRAIMQEIRGKESSGESMTTSTASGTRTCRTCQPNNCPQEDDIEREFRDNKHLGKLVGYSPMS